MARVAKVYSTKEMLCLRIVAVATERGAQASTPREAACFLAMQLVDSGEPWERETLVVTTSESVMQKLGVEDSTTLGEELWLMLANAARRRASYRRTADEALERARVFIESGEVAKLSRSVLDLIS